jgi:beta-lactamase regulating signal transducer with metallopeptidase domain
MHTFKRFYLLGSLLAAFAIPFITFVEYVEIPVMTQIIEQSNSNVSVVSSDGPEQYPTDYMPTVLWSIYFIGIVVLGFNFIKNLFQIIQRIQKNPKYKINRITNVLLLDHIIPHTFFNYIFLNKKKFEAKEIPSEVLLHEETHAKQKHSLDVLFIEFLQVLFWFNPLMYFMKKAIKLNHEFLADREVLDHGIKPSLYQSILLEFSSNSLQPQLANSINYSSIKKRFTVMKTKTSKKSILLRTLFLLPLLAIMLYGFSEKKFIERPSTVEISIPSVEQALISEYIDIRITKKGELIIQDSALIALGNLKSFLQKFNTKLTKEQRSNVVRALIKPDVGAPTDVINKVEAILSDYGVAQLDIVGPEKYTSPNQEIQVQEGATNSQIKEYNTLAKKYNAQPIHERIIKKKEIERLEYIYNLMTAQQKKKAQPFPECPPPPPAPKAVKGAMSAISPRPPSAPKGIQGERSTIAPKVNKREKSNIPPPPSPPDQNAVADKVIDEIIAHQDPYDELNAAIKLNKKDGLTVLPLTKIENRITPPTPVTPISPLDHVVEMAKKDATFYFEGKKISSDKAIDLLKKNKNLNIDSRGFKSKRPVVRISAQPIVIEN